MKEKDKTLMPFKDYIYGEFTFTQLKRIAKENGILPARIIENCGHPDIIKKHFYDRTLYTEERRCKVCHKLFISHSKTKEVCDDPDCKQIHENERVMEEYRLTEFKKNIANFLLQEIKRKKLAKSKKGKEVWARKTPEEKARIVTALTKGREEKKEFYKENGEKIVRGRKRNMDKRKLMKSALLQILNKPDEDTGVSNLMAMTEAVVNRVKQTGDPKAATFIRDTIDEDPKQKDLESANLVLFAAPPVLVNKFGDEIQDAEYREISEKEQYERLKSKYEPKGLEDHTQELQELTEEIEKL